MISRTKTGRSFGGLARYLMQGHKDQQEDKQSEILAAEGVRTDTVEHMIADFNRGRKVNPGLGQAVWHTSLSFNPDDASTLDSEKMREIAEDYMQEMGLVGTQFAIIRHRDKPGHEHLHIVANRVADDGHTISDKQNFYRSKEALVKLIQKYELTPPQGMRVEKQHAPADKAELAKYELRQALHQALATATDRPALLATLRAEKINVQEFTNKAGTVTGISFEKDGHTFKGSAVAREYSLAGLDKQLAANQVRQQAEAEQACQAAAQEAAAQAQRQVAAPARRQEAERQAVQLAGRSATERQEAQRKTAQAAKVPELPAVERKWQAAYPQYLAEIAQQNAPIQAFNKLIDSASEYLETHPNEEGLAVVMRKLAGDPHTAQLQADLTRQVKARANYQQNWESTYGQQAALEKKAKGGIFVSWAASDAAKEKVKYLYDPTLPDPDVLQADLLAFARAARFAARPAPTVSIEAHTYYRPEVVPLSLAAYAAQREAVVQAQTSDQAQRQAPGQRGAQQPPVPKLKPEPLEEKAPTQVRGQRPKR